MAKEKITFSINQDIIKKIKDYADENCINLSAMSQKLWESFLEEQKIKNIKNKK